MDLYAVPVNEGRECYAFKDESVPLTRIQMSESTLNFSGCNESRYLRLTFIKENCERRSYSVALLGLCFPTREEKPVPNTRLPAQARGGFDFENTTMATRQCESDR